MLNHTISVIIDGRSDDNSQYNPTSKDLTFGTGSVDDAEEAEGMAHKHGHAYKMTVPSREKDHYCASLGQELRDCLAARFFAEVKPEG
jgi:hypothetical protein